MSLIQTTISARQPLPTPTEEPKTIELTVTVKTETVEVIREKIPWWIYPIIIILVVALVVTILIAWC